jgi:hypothetical protein
VSPGSEKGGSNRTNLVVHGEAICTSIWQETGLYSEDEREVGHHRILGRLKVSVSGGKRRMYAYLVTKGHELEPRSADPGERILHGTAYAPCIPQGSPAASRA